MFMVPSVFKLDQFSGTWVGASQMICPIWQTLQQYATIRMFAHSKILSSLHFPQRVSEGSIQLYF